MSDANAPAQSALYHLALALIRSGGVSPIELVEAADRVDREGERDDPENETWQEFSHVLRLAALNLESEADAEIIRPAFGVIDGGKA